MTKQFAPAAERNREPILAVLQRVLPARGTVLEIASGTGQHAAYFSAHLAPRCWQPSDADPSNIPSIDAWRTECGAENLLPAVQLDVTSNPWPVEGNGPTAPITAIVAINLVHIAAWTVTEALMDGAARILPPDGVLYLYGPYMRAGRHTAASNAEFDQMLRRQNPAWGVREVETVAACALSRGLALADVADMPANNLSVIFTR
jgi:SAM-dependent methyltransferase